MMPKERAWTVPQVCVQAMAVAGLALLAAPAEAEADLNDMSIEELTRIEVISASKRPEPLRDAPAAIYVITHDDIIRSGAVSLPEMLRQAPNLQVAQITANRYAITARGFNGGVSDKLLVLVDGRSIYTPFSSGVNWDLQEVPPETIERSRTRAVDLLLFHPSAADAPEYVDGARPLARGEVAKCGDQGHVTVQ